MQAEIGEQLGIDLDRGSKVVMTFLCHYDRASGWSLRAIHRHSGELSQCPSIDVYRELGALELAQILEDLVAGSAGPFQLHGGVCSPRPPASA